MEKQWKQWETIFLGSKITADGDYSHEIKRRLLLERKAMNNLDSIQKCRDITLPTKVHLVTAMIFQVVMLWMWELDYKESWALKNWCFWPVVLEKTLESPLDCKEIQPVHSEGDQPWDFFGRTDAKAETPILWPPDVKNWLLGKDPDAGKDSRREEKGATEDEMAGETEDEMAGWHHWLDRPGFEQAPGVGTQGSLSAAVKLPRVKHNWVTELNWTYQERASDAAS